MRFLRTTLFALILVFPNVAAQDVLREAINVLVRARLGAGYHVGSMTNFDSVSAAEGFEDPYQTLRGCTIFTVLGELGDDGESSRGAIGIYRSEDIVWLSDTLVRADETNDATVFGTKDLNGDGEVDIITAWASGMRSPVESYWIFAWSGQTGTLISGVDLLGTSVIRAQGDNLHIVDLNGDGLCELEGRIPDFNSEGDSLITYGWDGVVFVPMRGLEGNGRAAPRDALFCLVRCSVTESHAGLRYEYTVENSAQSRLDLDEFNLGKRSGDFLDGLPTDWDFGAWNERPLVGWQSGRDNVLRRGQTQTFSFVSVGFPTPVPFFAQGYNYRLEELPRDLDSLYRDAVENAFRGTTLGPLNPANIPEPENILDSLASYLEKCRALGWIPSQVVASAYGSLLNSARLQVSDGDIASARQTLERLLNGVERDSSINLSCEAYALLKFNTEYLLSRLQIESPPALSSLTPGMTLTGSGPFDLVVTGTGFADGAAILWNGNACSTQFVSPTTLKTRIAGGAVASPVSTGVTVRNPDGTTTGHLAFAVVATLPAPLRPVLECVTRDRDEEFVAWFGYRNDNPQSVYLPVGRTNSFAGLPKDRGQTTLFLPGRTVRAFRVPFTGGNLTWTLNGRTSTASKKSPRCR
jgi:hypothetical protein